MFKCVENMLMSDCLGNIHFIAALGVRILFAKMKTFSLWIFSLVPNLLHLSSLYYLPESFIEKKNHVVEQVLFLL